MRTLLLGLLTVSVAAPAVADTVWLKNGRVLQVEDARIENGTVVFRTHGVQVTLPADFVRRVRRNDGRSPRLARRATERRLVATKPVGPLRARSTPRPRATPSPTPPDSFYFDPGDRAYWQDKMAWVRDQISGLEAKRTAVRSRGRARNGDRYTDLTADRQELLAWRALESALRAEARRLGVPSEWLRVDSRLSD